MEMKPKPGQSFEEFAAELKKKLAERTGKTVAELAAEERRIATEMKKKGH